MKRVAIIGAGLGGLSAAAFLVSNDYEVHIFEKESLPGGRARRVTSQSTEGSFLTEVGPTVFTMLDVAKKPFSVLGVDMDDEVEMLSVDPSYRGIFRDGSTLDWPNNPEKILDVVSHFAGQQEAEGFGKYIKWLEKLVEVEYDNFVAKNFANPLDLAKNPIALLKLLQMGAFSKMDKKVSQFISDPRLQSMSTFQSLYAGVTPAQALAVYCIISYMDLIQGVYYPKGGMCAYGEKLSQILENAGVKINYDVQVKNISQVGSSKVQVLTESGKEVFDAVVCNADLPLAYPQLFGEEIPRKIAKAKYSPSCLIYVVGGLSSREESGAHHTIYFSGNDKYSFEQLVKNRTMMDDPSFLISNPNISDLSISPKGTNVYYVLEPCPHLDSSVDFKRHREFHIERMRGHIAKSGITIDRIDTEIFIDPIDWEQQSMFKGTPFSLAHTFFQSGPFRPSNEHKKIAGLFFSGTGTTPGVGIPMVIESGKLSAMKVDNFLSNRT